MPKNPNIDLATAIAQYLDRIEAEGQAKASITTAHYALHRFLRAVGTSRNPNPQVHTLTPGDLDEYCFGPSGIRRGIGADSFNRYRSVLKVFFEWCLLRRYTDVNPMEAVPRARPDAVKSRLLLTASELVGLLDHCTNPIQRIGCAIGMNTGLRGNDIRHLKVFDASLASGTIQTEIRKTRKLDIKPISLDLHRELTVWLDQYRQLAGDLDGDWYLVPSYYWGPVWANQDGGRKLHLRPTQMLTQPWTLVKRPLAAMGYPVKQEGFHTLRRSSARALFEHLRDSGEGKDHALMVVQAYLNHSSTVQTQAYIGLDTERTIRDAVLKDRPFLSSLAEREQERLGVEVRRIG